MSKLLKPEKIQRLINLIINAAKSRRENAGYDGRYDDGGARELEKQVEFFNYGWDMATQTETTVSVPPDWKEFEVQLDPEYEQYQRLKNKFKDR